MLLQTIPLAEITRKMGTAASTRGPAAYSETVPNVKKGKSRESYFYEPDDQDGANLFLKFVPQEEGIDTEISIVEAVETGDCNSIRKANENFAENQHVRETIFPRILLNAASNHDVELFQVVTEYVGKYLKENPDLLAMDVFVECAHECLNSDNASMFTALLGMFPSNFLLQTRNEQIFRDILFTAIQKACCVPVLEAVDVQWFATLRHQQLDSKMLFHKLFAFYQTRFSKSGEIISIRLLLYYAIHVGIKRHVFEILKQSEQATLLQSSDEFDLTIVYISQKFPDIAHQIEMRLSSEVNSRTLDTYAKWYHDVSFASNALVGHPSDVPVTDKDVLKKMRKIFTLNESFTSHPEYQEVLHAVRGFLKILAKRVSTKYPLFAFKPVLTGSSEENMACFFPDSLDALFVFINLEQHFDIMGNPHTGIKLVAKADSNKEMLRDLIQDDILKPAKLRHVFDKIIEKRVCDLAGKLPDTRLTVEPTEHYSRAKNCANIFLTWRGDVFKDLKIKIKTLGAFEFCGEADVLPSHQFMHQSGPLFITLGVFKGAAELDTVDVCFSCLESEIINNMPSGIREGYKIAKLMRNPAFLPTELSHSHDALARDLRNLCTSLMLKTCLLFKTRLSDDDDENEQRSGVMWAMKIYKKLLRFISDGHMPHYFLNNGNFGKHPEYRFLFYCDKASRGNSLQTCLCCRQRNALLDIVDRFIHLLKMYSKYKRL